MSVDWERVTALFGATRVLDRTDRAAFLDAACRGDATLRAEIEALLATDSDDSFLEDRPGSLLREGLSHLPDLVASGRLLKDRYRIDRPLGTGGQALVYRATDEVLSRAVVVKVMRADGRGNHWLKTRFEHEMVALSRIDHPGVVGIVDVGDLADGSPFLVIQHVDGVSLRELLSADALAPARAAGILRQLGAALSAAHAAGVAHQDLKPENVMLQQLNGDGDVVKLIDFGIAKIERSQVEAGVTTVMVAGTIRYMAPEQFQGENSSACDVYALALLMCEMLSGQPDVRALPASVGKRTRRLLDAALSFRPSDRPADVRQWCEDLSQALLEGDRFRRRLTLRLVGTAAVFGVVALGARVVLPYYVEPVRIVEKVGAFDPLQEGFVVHGGVTGTVALNPGRDGYDGWRAFGIGAGDYYQTKLTSAQRRLAMKRGWTLSVVMRPDEGFVFTGIDLLGAGQRYDILVFKGAETDLVRLQTQIVPVFQGLELFLPHVEGAYHRYELRYDPSLQSAALWVDGIKRLEQYRGHSQFQEDMGLYFGASPYKTDKGAASFQSVRFEITP